MNLLNKIIVTALTAGWIFSANAASFDCSKASQLSEKMVCANPSLSKLDDQMYALYSSAKDRSSNPEQLKADQINWIKEVRSCGSSEACVFDLYNKRISQLTSSGQSQNAVTTTVNIPQQGDSTPSTNAEGQVEKSTPEVKNEVKTTEAEEDGSPVGYLFVGILTIVLLLGPAAYFVSSVRKSVPAIGRNRFVRNTNNGEMFTLFIVSLITSFSWFFSLFGGVSGLGIVISLFFTGILLLVAKAFAVTEAGVAYDAENDLIEIEDSGRGEDSFFDKFKLSYWTSSLRRVKIPTSDIRSVSGWTGVTETTRYNEHSKSLDTTTSYTHTLNLSTVNGEWSITFSNRKKYDAAHTLICEAAHLE